MQQRVHVRLEGIDLKRLERLSQKSGKPVSTLIRELTIRQLDQIDIEHSRRAVA
jgi:predicted DNA-binding protein